MAPVATRTDLPSGWTWVSGGGRFRARHAREGFTTGEHADDGDAVAEAHQIHRREIADGDLFTPQTTTDSLPPMPEPTAALIRSQYDAETGDVVEVTPDLARQHAALHRMADRATLAKAVVYREIAERKTFLAAGCSSFKEYVEDVRGESYASAKMYLRAGRTFGGLLAGGDAEGQSIGLLPEVGNAAPEGQPGGLADDLAGLGVFKLDGLASVLDEEDVEHLRESPEIALPSGKRVTIDELREMSQREAKKMFKEERRALRDANADLREQLKLATSERDALAENAERVEDRAADARAKEELYGPVARRVEDQRAQLNAAREHLDECRQTLIRSGVSAESPAEIREQARDLMAYLRRTVRDMAAELAPVLDLSAFADDLAYTDETDA